MTKECARCNTKMDTDNDAHYRCKTHDYVICEECHKRQTTCPHCGKRLTHQSDSYQKRAFDDPAGRGLLGF